MADYIIISHFGLLEHCGKNLFKEVYFKINLDRIYDINVIQ